MLCTTATFRMRMEEGTIHDKRCINRSISSCTFLPDRDPDELVWKHLRADTVGRMTITEKADFKARSAHPCAKLQNDPEKIPTKNHRSNMPPDSAVTYGLINNSGIDAAVIGH